MKKELRHSGATLALVAAILYSTHKPHADVPADGPEPHHCCVCNTVAMTAPAEVPTPQPFLVCADAPRAILVASVSLDLCSADAPRAPPLA